MTHPFPTILSCDCIREFVAIFHVLRCFEDDDIQHVENKVDPVADAETVETELLLSDLESLEKRVPAFAKKAAQGDKEAKIAASVLGQALELLREGKPARLTEPKDDRSEEHTSELQSLMRISYAVFCLKKNKKHKQYTARQNCKTEHDNDTTTAN